MLHWLKELRPATCKSCQEFESKISFLEQQLDQYRKRLEAFEKLHAFISSTCANTEKPVTALFKKIGQVSDDMREISLAATDLHTLISRIKEAQSNVL